MVIDLMKRRLTNKMQTAIDSGRVPLVDKLPQLPQAQERSPEYSQQLERVKESLERINSIMNRPKEQGKLKEEAK